MFSLPVLDTYFGDIIPLWMPCIYKLEQIRLDAGMRIQKVVAFHPAQTVERRREGFEDLV